MKKYVIITMFLCSCGTTANLFSHGDPDLYGATLFDIGMIHSPCCDLNFIPLVPVGIIDLPISLAFDTLLFPLIYFSSRSNKRSGNIFECPINSSNKKEKRDKIKDIARREIRSRENKDSKTSLKLASTIKESRQQKMKIKLLKLVNHYAPAKNGDLEANLEERLLLIIKHSTPKTGYQIAYNSYTPPKILAKLAAYDNLIEEIAKNPNTNANTLRKMLKLKMALFINKDIATHPNTPDDVFEKLIKINNPEITKAVISNPNTPMSILKKLAKN
ncbi:YceK/YidQ family lipoprotein [Candidatus Uabimicrobium sp. HlEnr_7]|uniref:YceK/YidQ family lipoprotein n=1 Tax=Candidatus Uabimicrobium helgolandensis TaxID=3095367 RepID=UPI003558C64F